MEKSILKSIRKMLNIGEDVTAFDGELIPHINAAFSALKQLGVDSASPIEDASEEWDSLGLPDEQLSLTKTILQMKVKLAFDPPGTSYLIDVTKGLIEEQEYRLKEFIECPKTWPVEEVVTP